MNPEMIFVFALIGVAAILMASNRVRFDIVALLVVLALMLSGVLSVGQALACIFRQPARSLVEYSDWNIEPIRLCRLLTLKAAP